MNNWKIKKLGEVCETTSGGTPSRRNPKYYNGTIPWVKSGELDKGIIYDTEEKITEEAIKNSSAKVFPKGTLLIALYGATIGKLAFLGTDAATNQAICGIFKNDNIDLNYLYNFLLFKRPKLVRQGIGGAQPNISQTILKNLDLPIPPLSTQQAIVAKIEELFSELDQGIAALKKAQEQLKTYRQSVLKWAFEGKLSRNHRLSRLKDDTDVESSNKKISEISQSETFSNTDKEGQHHRLSGLKDDTDVESSNKKISEISQSEIFSNTDKEGQHHRLSRLKDDTDVESSNKKISEISQSDIIRDSDNGELPEGWEWKKLGNLFKTTSGGTPSRRNPNYYNGNIPWVKSGELDKGIIYDTEEKITKEAIKNSSAKIFPKGTLLIALYGATIGKLAFLGVDASTNQAICGIFENDSANIKYLYNFLLFKRPKLIQQGIGGAQPNISQTILKGLDFPLPPLPEQHLIVQAIESRLSVADKLAESIHESLQKAESLRQSILKQAFEGKLVINELEK